MKQTHIRYFKHKDDVIPYDSNPLDVSQELSYCRENFSEFGQCLLDWFKQYPDGKVDFVLL